MLRERIEWIPLTFYAIFRNKRRSFAMISGIILATTILSGIFVYSKYLQQENFDTVVNNTPFELGFDLTENETLTSMQDLADIVSEDERVLDYTILTTGGEYDLEAKIDKTGSGVVDFGTTVTGNPGNPVTTIEPIFINENRLGAVIPQRMFSENFEGNVSSFGEGNATIIARSVASRLQLRVGDILNNVNITMYESLVEDEEYAYIARLIEYQGILKNVKVVGIYDISFGNVGILSEALEPTDIFLSQDLLAQFLPDIDRGLKEKLGYALAIKINEDKFDLSNSDNLNDGINRFINEVVKDLKNYKSPRYPNGMKVEGFNLVGLFLEIFGFYNIIITIFDVILVIPAVLLSLYLLIYGIEMSLEERRREIAIKKVQGANSRQIFGEMRNEAFMIFMIGSFLGYLGGTFGAWLIGSSIGFLKFEVSSITDFQDFYTWGQTTVFKVTFPIPGQLFWVMVVVGLILTIQVYKKGRAFINQEVSEAVQRYEESKIGFLRRNKLDIVFFLIGAAGVINSILEQRFDRGVSLNSFLQFVVNGLGPLFFWIGGALVGARIVKWVPLKLEGVFLSLNLFKDIKRIISSGLRRRGGTDRLAIIIVLTLSIATLAAAQGITNENHSLRTLEWEVGSDFQVNYALVGDYSSELLNLTVNNENIIQSVLPLGLGPGVKILNDDFTIIGIDAVSEYDNLVTGRSTGIWHSDAFKGNSPEKALKLLKDNPLGIFVSSGTRNKIIAEINENVDLSVSVINSTSNQPTTKDLSVKILGDVDHIPGGFSGDTIITSSLVIKRLFALSMNVTETAFDTSPMRATKYLVKTKMGDSISNNEVNLIREQLRQNPLYSSDRSLKVEIDDFESGGGSFGIPGLLSLNFLVAVSAALISTFAFTAILMERRKAEFAILRAIGAKKGQIYKIALGENTLLVSTAVIWGIIIGWGITYLFNGVFNVFNIVLGAGPLKRQIIFPWSNIIMIGLAISIGMLLATLVSVRSAARQDLSIATRVV